MNFVLQRVCENIQLPIVKGETSFRDKFQIQSSIGRSITLSGVLISKLQDEETGLMLKELK
jgi:hypothetical protein